MFDYPKQAEFNRPVPKSKIYGFGKPTRAVRSRFVTQVGEIVWKYKLSPETVNLPARHGVEEIQVFVIALRTGQIAEDVLRTIDKAVPSPIFFELMFEGRVKSIAAYKDLSEADASRSLVDVYFETPWMPFSAARPPLPPALDLAGLYEQILRRHMAVPPRPGEALKDHIERVKQIRNQEKEYRRLESRLRREVQFNRKVELNARLRLQEIELAQLQKS
jgi:hypothetical protein